MMTRQTESDAKPKEVTNKKNATAHPPSVHVKKYIHAPREPGEGSRAQRNKWTHCRSLTRDNIVITTGRASMESIFGRQALKRPTRAGEAEILPRSIFRGTTDPHIDGIKKEKALDPTKRSPESALGEGICEGRVPQRAKIGN